MSATGIGAAVRRKEDFRFVTGKGQYTDDINRPGQSDITMPATPQAAWSAIRKMNAAHPAKR